MTSDVVKIKVKVSGEDQRLTKDFLHYGEMHISRNDPELDKMVNETLKGFKGTAEEVTVQFTYTW